MGERINCGAANRRLAESLKSNHEEER